MDWISTFHNRRRKTLQGIKMSLHQRKIGLRTFSVILLSVLTFSSFCRAENKPAVLESSRTWSQELTADQLAVGTPVNSEVFRKIAGYIDGPRENVNDYLKDAGYPADAKATQPTWNQLPPATKLTLASKEAFDVSERNGATFLALLSRRLAQDYPAITKEPELADLLTRAVVRETTVTFSTKTIVNLPKVPEWAAKPIIALTAYVENPGAVSVADLARLTPLSPIEQVEILARAKNNRIALQELFASSAELYSRQSESKQNAELAIRQCLASWVRVTADAYPTVKLDSTLAPWRNGKVEPVGPAYQIVGNPPPDDSQPDRIHLKTSEELSKVLKGNTDFRPGGIVFKQGIVVPNVRSVEISNQSLVFSLGDGPKAEFKIPFPAEELRRLAVATLDWGGLVVSQNHDGKGGSVTLAHPMLYGTTVLESLAETEIFTGQIFYGVRYADGSRYTPQVSNVPNRVDDLISYLNDGPEDVAWISFLEYFSSFDCNPAMEIGRWQVTIDQGSVIVDDNVLRIGFAPGIVTETARSRSGTAKVSEEICMKVHRAVAEFNKKNARFMDEAPSLATTTSIAKAVGLILGQREHFRIEELRKGLKVIEGPPSSKYAAGGEQVDAFLSSCRSGELTDQGRELALKFAHRLSSRETAQEMHPRVHRLLILLSVIEKE